MSIVEDISVAARARRLKEARAKVFPSAQAAARSLGLNGVTVRAHENAQNGFPIDVAERYAKAYGVGLDWLLSGREDGVAREPEAHRPEGMALVLHQLPNGKARLQINKVVPFDVALKVLALIEGIEG